MMIKLYEKLVRWISRRFWNKTVHYIILEAMKRNIVSSWSAHELLGAWNAECFPERGHASFLKADEMVICPACKGLGYSPKGWQPICGQCAGRGKVKTPSRPPTQTSSPSIPQPVKPPQR